MDNDIIALPKIIILGTDSDRSEKLETGRQYRLYIGKNTDRIVMFALSTQSNHITQAKLLLKDVVGMDSVEFARTPILLDVYIPTELNGKLGIYAKFWGENYHYSHEESVDFEPYARDGMEKVWKERFGISFSFYPFRGPSDDSVRHMYPSFMKT